jgi:hypothetical protein
MMALGSLQNASAFSGVRFDCWSLLMHFLRKANALALVALPFVPENVILS